MTEYMTKKNCLLRVAQTESVRRERVRTLLDGKKKLLKMMQQKPCHAICQKQITCKTPSFPTRWRSFATVPQCSGRCRTLRLRHVSDPSSLLVCLPVPCPSPPSYHHHHAQGMSTAVPTETSRRRLRSCLCYRRRLLVGREACV